MPNDLQHGATSLELVLTNYVGSAYSPQVEVEDIEGGHNVSITHKGPYGIVTDSFDVMDGVSPTVDITSTAERHTITITDAQGPHVYEVDTYADEERARVTAENGRASAESARVSAESARADAETGRSTAESARDEAESARSAAEATRAENETTRVTNETARVNAESTRNEAEQAREQAETVREAEWYTLSAQATTATQAANNAAQEASQAASDATDAAQTASQTATSVDLAEQGRVQAEQARVTAEQGRATAEQGRVSAETERATEWAEIESDAQSTIQAAEAATTAANDAAALATRAAASTWNAGNVLKGTLAESTVLTADDAWAAPPKGVEVYGKSTQASYTGINLWDEVWEYSVGHVRGTNRIPLEPNVTYFLTAPTGAQWANVYCRDANGTDVLVANAMATFTTPADVSYGIVIADGSYGTTYKNDICVNVSDPAINGTYEPYTGGKAAPNPDYPQEIKSVDDLTLNIVGKNLCINSDASFSLTGSQYATFTSVATPVSLGAASVTISVDAVKPSSQTLAAYNEEGRIIGDMALGSDGRYYVTPTSSVYLTNALNAKQIRFYSKPYTGGSSVVTTVSNCALYLNSTDAAYEPYVGTSVSIPLSNNPARSLPNGTRDQITLTYQGPSVEHDGWGVFSVTLEQNAMLTDMGELAWVNYYGNRIFYADVSGMANGASDALQAMCEIFTSWNTSTLALFGNHAPANSIALLTGSAQIAVMLTPETAYESVAAFKAAMSGVYAHVPLATPTTIDLGTIELPVLPNPLTAWADGGSAQPTLSMTYEQDINIVIGELRSAIADMATS